VGGGKEGVELEEIKGRSHKTVHGEILRISMMFEKFVINTTR